MMRESLQPNETYGGGDNTATHDDDRKEISCPGRHFIEDLEFHTSQPCLERAAPKARGDRARSTGSFFRPGGISRLTRGDID
jgi:hypothetical protein